MKLESKRLVLREYKLSDASQLSTLTNNTLAHQFMASMPYPNTPRIVLKHIKESSIKSKKRPRTTYRLVITLKGNNSPIGGIALSEIDFFNETASIGYWLGKKYQHKGYATEAINRIIEFAFKKLELRRIEASAHPKNRASIKVLKKIGFVKEGLKRKSTKMRSTGKIRDSIIFGLLKEKWKITK